MNKVFTKKNYPTVSDKAQEVSYELAEIIAKSMKSHTIAESIILPARWSIAKTMFKKEYEKEIYK